MAVRSITCFALMAWMDRRETFALLDVREQGEYHAGQIPTATPLARRQIEFRLADLVPVRSTPVIVYDEGGQRAGLAARSLERMGYVDARCLAGGLAAWVAAGGPTITGVNVPSKAFGEKVHRECRVPEIAPEELHRRRARGERFIVLDARTPEEYRRFCIPGGLNVPGGDLVLWAEALARDPATTVVVNCAGRTRSIIGAQALRRLGLTNVVALRNGTMGWLLAGLELERSPARPVPPAPPGGRAAADRLAARVAAEEGIPLIGVGELLALGERAARHTCYRIDVRSAAEYAGGHIPGFRWVPGGQAVQRTDEHIAVRNGTAVLACDGQARATMAAYWLRQMGLGDVRVLAGGTRAWTESGRGLEAGAAERLPWGFAEARAAARCVSPADLASRLGEAGRPLVLDVGTSLEFEAGHVPGARWLSRGWLELTIASVAADRGQAIVITCPAGDHSTLAAATLREMGYRDPSVLAGGVEAWRRAGLPMETGLAGAITEANDVVLSASITGDREAMRRYLEWEIALGQMSA
jgi:rhodanese-related sulfurtransferase